MRILKWNHQKFMKISILKQMISQIILKFEWIKTSSLKSKKIIRATIELACKVILVIKSFQDRLILESFLEVLPLFNLLNCGTMRSILLPKIMKIVLPQQIIFSKI